MPLSLLASFLTAAVGAGGTTLMYILMSLVMPVGIILPVQGAVMAVQNGFRSGLLWQRIDWPFVGVACAGSVIGAVLAGPLLMTMPDNWLRIILGLGLLLLVWVPKMETPLEIPGVSRRAMVAMMAAVVSVLTMFVGAGGVLFSAIRHRGGRRKEGLVADQGIVMVVQQLIRVVIFGVAGFAFWPYLPLMLGMTLAGLVGTYFGVVVLKRMPNRRFDRYFKWAVTAVALSMVWRVVF